MRLVIASVQSLEFQTSGSGGRPKVTFLPVKNKHSGIAQHRLFPAHLKSCQSCFWTCSQVTQNSILTHRQNIHQSLSTEGND